MKILNKTNCPIDILAATNKNKKICSVSSSGGIFSILANSILEQNGVVFGSTLDNSGKCYHIATNNINDIRGSKYLQSKIGNTFHECKEYLKQGKIVLFSGTPCQIDALLKKIGHNEKLYTVDVFCHGVPPQKLFKLYIQWLSNNIGLCSHTYNYSFRNKKFGWSPELLFSCSYIKNNKEHLKYIKASEDPYYSSFLESKTLLNKCYKCPFSQKNRVSDFSLGDFWDIDKYHSDFYKEHHKEGISVVMLNTKKSKDFFDKYCINQCNYIYSNYSNAKQCVIDADDDTIYKKEIEYKFLREKLFLAMSNNDYNFIFKDLLKVKKKKSSFKSKLKSIVPANIKKFITNTIKKR